MSSTTAWLPPGTLWWRLGAPREPCCVCCMHFLQMIAAKPSFLYPCKVSKQYGHFCIVMANMLTTIWAEHEIIPNHTQASLSSLQSEYVFLQRVTFYSSIATDGSLMKSLHMSTSPPNLCRPPLATAALLQPRGPSDQVARSQGAARATHRLLDPAEGFGFHAIWMPSMQVVAHSTMGTPHVAPSRPCTTGV
jgi:hypothetical protein